jgi:flagellar L-ring protein precursor FlgH
MRRIFEIKIMSIMAIGILLFSGMEALNAQFIQNHTRSLFSDVKAFKVGDAIMVLITEETSADNSASTSEDRQSQISAGVGANSGSTAFNVDGTLKTGNTFRGAGQTQRKENIKSRLSARVVEVDDNGNLIIEGTRNTKINGESQKIIIKGTVRPVDVMSNNSVYSYSIMDLTLYIDGDGTITKMQEPGFITKFLRILF